MRAKTAGTTRKNTAPTERSWRAWASCELVFLPTACCRPSHRIAIFDVEATRRVVEEMATDEGAAVLVGSEEDEFRITDVVRLSESDAAALCLVVLQQLQMDGSARSILPAPLPHLVDRAESGGGLMMTAAGVVSLWCIANMCILQVTQSDMVCFLAHYSDALGCALERHRLQPSTPRHPTCSLSAPYDLAFPPCGPTDGQAAREQAAG